MIGPLALVAIGVCVALLLWAEWELRVARAEITRLRAELSRAPARDARGRFAVRKP